MKPPLSATFDASGPAPGEQIAREPPDEVEGRDAPRDSGLVAISDGRQQVVLQVLADPRHVGHHRDARRAQLVGRAHPREEEQVRRTDRPGAEQHLALGAGQVLLAALPVAHSHGAAALDDDGRDERVGLHREVTPRSRGREEADRRAAPLSAADGGLVQPHAFLLGAVEIAVLARTERLGRRLHEHLAHGVHLDVAHVQRSAGAVVFAGAARVVLGALEVRENVGEAPAGVARVAPGVVVVPVPAHVNHVVDRARAPEHLAARPVHAAAPEVLERLGEEGPVEPTPP